MTDGPAEYVGQSVQFVLGLVFLAAVAAKLRRPSVFVSAVRGYQLVPQALIGSVAVAVMAAESLVAISMLTGRVFAAGLATAGVLLSGFAMAMGVNLRRGRVTSCGCFGSSSERISPRTLLRVGVMLAATITLMAATVGWQMAPLDVVRLAGDGLAGVERLTVTAAFGAFLFVVATSLYHIPEISQLLRRSPRRT